MKKYEIDGETIYEENGSIVVERTYYNSADILFGREPPRIVKDKISFSRKEIEERLNDLDEDWMYSYCMNKWDRLDYIEDDIEIFNTYLNVLDNTVIKKEEREVCFDKRTFKATCAILSKEDCVNINKALSASNDTVKRIKRIFSPIPHIIICEDEEDANNIFKRLRCLDYHDECNQTYCNVDIERNMICIECGDY